MFISSPSRFRSPAASGQLATSRSRAAAARQLGDVKGDAAGFVAGQQVGGGLPFVRGLLDASAQNDACRWIYQMGAFARSADDGLISMGIHGHIVCGKAFNAKAHVRAASGSDSFEKQSELIAKLEGSKWRPIEPPYALFYDAPFTLPFFRRNEAAVTVAQIS